MKAFGHPELSLKSINITSGLSQHNSAFIRTAEIRYGQNLDLANKGFPAQLFFI